VTALAPLLRAAPDDPQLIRLEGLCHERAGDPERALQSLERATTIGGSSPDARADLVLLLTRLRRTTSAATEADRLLERFPNIEIARRAAGEAYLSAARYRDALACFDWILGRSPTDVLALIKRGFALASLGDYEASGAAFDKAKRADPQAVERFCISLSGRAEAPAVLEPRAIHLWALYLAQCECDWTGRDALVAALKTAGESGVAASEPALAFVSLLLPTTQEERHALARTVAARIEARCPTLPPQPRAHAPRRVGILSPDFHEHLNAHILLPLFELLDRKRFELFAYSLGPDDGSDIRARIRRASHRFRDLRLLDSRAAAQQIRTDGIDILLDLGGYSSGARSDIAAFRPAPVQALYLGFSGTLGSRRVGYVIADRTVLPPEDEPNWSEKPIYLPHTWFLYDFRSPSAVLPRAARANYGLPADAFVFCAFHRAEKIEPESFDLWMRVLQQVPASVLWLYADEERVRERVRREASHRGVEPQRLVFTAREPRAAYLARFPLSDLLLDSLQHNATTTACDAFSAGVPMLTLRGKTFTSRIGESLLQAAGLPELVAPDKAAYVELAVQLAADRDRLNSYRRTLEARSGPLFDTASRVREIEAALTQMWRRYEQSGDRGR
jgi:predicted O-linked N-acetylglucosamine transferase (SPINDLY family)